MAEQLVLPFGYQYAEDRASLLLAINSAGLRRLDRAFVLLVFDVTSNGWLHRSYNEIGEMLHVSYSTARRCVARCVEAGIVVAQEERYRTGGQRDNAYSIDWEGVRSYCFNSTLTEVPAAQGEQPPAQTEHPPAHPEQPPAQTEHPPAQTEHPPAQTEHPYKEYKNTLDPTKEPSPPSEKPIGGGGSLEQWGEIRSRLKSHGMADTHGAIAAAKDDRMTPDQTGAVIDEWEAARPAWDIGALYWRLTRGSWPERAAPIRERDLAEQEKRRTRELLAAIPQRTRADPAEPSLAQQLRSVLFQEDPA